MQTAAWPHVVAGRHTLIVSPTGTGKTLAAFFAVLHELAREHARGELRDDDPRAVRLAAAGARLRPREEPQRAVARGVRRSGPHSCRASDGGHAGGGAREAIRQGRRTSCSRRRRVSALLLSQAKWLSHLASRALGDRRRNPCPRGEQTRARTSASASSGWTTWSGVPGASFPSARRSNTIEHRTVFSVIGLSATVAPGRGGALPGGGRTRDARSST